MRDAVRDIASYFPTAIVSGRCRDKVHFYLTTLVIVIKIPNDFAHYFIFQVYSFVRLAELYYAGSHGMDIKGPVKGPKNTKSKV